MLDPRINKTDYACIPVGGEIESAAIDWLIERGAIVEAYDGLLLVFLPRTRLKLLRGFSDQYVLIGSFGELPAVEFFLSPDTYQSSVRLTPR